MPKKTLCRLTPAVLIAFALAVSFSSRAARSVTLEWDPNSEPSLAGYRLYFGTQSRAYASTVDVRAPLTIATASNLTSGVTYYFAVTAYDTNGAESDFSSEVSYTVPLDANAAPRALPTNVITLAGQSVSITLRGTDPDGNLLSFLITSLPAHGTVSGTPPNLVYTPRDGFSGSDALTFVVRDALTSSAPATVSISVNALNLAPTLKALSSVNLVQNSGPRTVTLSGITSGSTNEIQPLSVTATSSNPALFPDPTINYTSPNTTGTLLLTPTPNAWGTAMITVTVDDHQNTNNIIRRSFAVRINNPPTLNPLPNLSVAENAPTQIVALSGITSGAANEAQPLTVTAISSNPELIPNPAVSHTSPNTTGTLSFQPVAHATGTATIQVTVRDGQLVNSMVTRSFVVTVEAAPPVIGNLELARGDARGFVLTWTTEKPASFAVDFGATPALGSSMAAVSARTNHMAVFTKLQPATTYYFRFRTADLSANESITDMFTVDTPATTSLGWPAESGLLGGSMAVGTSPAARGGRYISPSGPEGGSVSYDFSVPVGLTYRLWCRALAPIGGRLYVTIDGGAATTVEIPASTSGLWKWVLLRGADGTDDALFPNLAAGRHQIVLSGGTSGAFLDDFILVNDAEWAPICERTAPRLWASGASADAIDLAWTDPGDNEGGFMIESSSDGLSFTPLVFLGAGTTSYRDNGLANATRYYRVTAFNDIDMTAYSNMAAAEPATDQPPLGPTILKAMVENGSSVRLSWNDSASSETGYLLERSFDGVNFSAVQALSENALSASDIPPGYGWVFYRVRALNGAGFSEPSEIATVLF